MAYLNISDKEIKALAAHALVYQKGLAYAESGRVSQVNFDTGKRILSAIVTGSSKYMVELEFNRNGYLISYDCTCPANDQYYGACKHVVALMKTVQKEIPASAQDQTSAYRATEEFLSFFNNRSFTAKEEELTLETELSISAGYSVSANVSFRLGLNRLYVIKDVEDFLKHIKSGSSLDFGKQFTFEPSSQRFREEDQPVIDLLLEMFDQFKAWEEMGELFSQSSVFRKKQIPLGGVYLQQFLDVIGDKIFTLELSRANYPPCPTQVNRQGLPLEFSLKANGEDLALAFKTKEQPVQLTRDGRYYLYNQIIYEALPEQQELLPPILNALRRGISRIVLPPAKKEFFVSEALPSIEKMGKVTIDPKVAKKFNKEELITKIYLERGAGNRMTARVEFHYGSIVINPFTQVSESRKDNNSEDQILIRSLEQERKILGILEQASFNVNQGKIHLDDEELMFEFASIYLPLLQQLAELYYAEDFKLTIRPNVSFSGRVRLDEELDLLEVSFEYGDIKEEELSSIFHALKMKKRYYRLKDGSFLDLKQPELGYVADLIDNLHLSPEDLEQRVIELPKFRAMYIDNYLRQINLPGIQRNRAFKQLVQSILEPQDGEYEVPQGLEGVLRDYQKTGFKWLKSLAAYGLGGILADDMGLGKTLQVLAFILYEKEFAKESFQPAMVIAPTSLVYNWQEEAKKFVPGLKVLAVEGTPKIRQAQLTDIHAFDLVVTSYPMLRRDIETYKELDFSYCFLDEAQHIKNPQTINAKSVQQIKAKGYFALTGTPIENSLSELWSIFNFIMPGYLLSHQEFRRLYEIPIVKGEDPSPLTELSRQVTPFILRRLKKQVLLELPDKIETRLTAQMTDEQRKIYLAFLHEAKTSIAREIAVVGFEKSQIKILAMLTRLRQICCHPGMFVEDYAGESGKMQLFEEVVADALDGGHRILVFSQFTSMLSIIQEYLNREGIEHFYLRGSTKASERVEMVQAFNEGVGKVFLISLKAGGTGLNLTGADMVIHFDPWWNPAVEDQATDRAHRIGQKNTVQVIKLVTQGTIEEKVQALQEKKKELIESVIQPGETWLSKFTEEQLRDLFEVSVQNYT